MMKKIISFIISIVVLIICVSCAPSNTILQNNVMLQNNALNGESKTTFSADDMNSYLKLFLDVSVENPNGILGSRAPFSASEEKTAQHIKEFALSLTDSEGAPIYDVKTNTFTVDGKTSQNVIIKKKNPSSVKQVIIGTNYDNMVIATTVSEDTESINAGALENGTGCALVFALMDYYKDITLQFDIVFAFFGASNVYNAGAAKYANEMTETEVNNTLLMLNLHRFGGKNIYLYTDEVDNSHHKYIQNIAQKSGVAFENIPKSLPVIGGVVTERYPYTTWALNGIHSPFMDKYINISNIYSADYSYFYVTDTEMRGYENRSFTKGDTYTALINDLPHFAEQMNNTATAIISLLGDSDFEAVMEESRNNLNAHSWALKPIIVNVIVMGLILILGIILFLLVRRFDKKYPYKPTAAPKINIPVFGSDYEKNKPESEDDNPFSGY